MVKKHCHDNDANEFSDAIEVACDELRSYLESLDYSNDQVSEIIEQFTEHLETSIVEFVEDLPDPEETDECD